MAKKVTSRLKEVKRRRRTFFREWRKYRDLTLERAAELSGMTAGNISAMERGAQGYTQDGLERLAEAYRCNPAQLLTVNPEDDDAIWSLWDKAKEPQREKIVDYARFITKAGSGS